MSTQTSPRKKLAWPKPFTIDLSKSKDRWKVLFGLLGLVVIGLGLLTGGVQAYNYTESVPFCGTVCHSMYPQLTRYQESPHAMVACTHCHVGPGAQAFVQSKIDGTRQLVATILDNYHRPITSPVVNLRPAREVCENCHSPATFKDNIIKVIKHYESDEANTPIQSTLILKMGGGDPMEGIHKGIHWHISNEVYYIPLDRQRQQMGWVGVKMDDGSLKEYFARDLLGMGQTAFVQKARDEGTMRKLDCIDCHNRTAHYIPYPEQSIDTAISLEKISPELPYIRKNAVELLSTKFASHDEAFAAIEQLRTEYQGTAKPELIDQAVETIKDIYAKTNFPDMNLDWKTNPNNERHTPTLGCFRCHDDNHVYMDAAGNEETISSECNLCHTVPIVGKGDEILLETPVIVGEVPATHQSFSWTVEHRNITEAQQQECLNCHGRSFCNNGACHNLNHPENMLFTHAEEFKQQGEQVCYTCHQNVTCIRCHSSGIIKNP